LPIAVRCTGLFTFTRFCYSILHRCILCPKWTTIWWHHSCATADLFSKFHNDSSNYLTVSLPTNKATNQHCDKHWSPKAILCHLLPTWDNYTASDFSTALLLYYYYNNHH